MSRTLLVAGAASTVLLLGLSAAGAPAVAQPVEETPSLDRITIVAPRITHRRGGIGNRVQVETAEKTAYVAYNDLDLTRTADLYRLQDRVIAAAEQVCGELAELYPEGEPSMNTCVSRAIDDSMVLVQQAARRELSLASSEWE